MSDSGTVCRFRRMGYHRSDFRGVTPRWHIAARHYANDQAARYFEAVRGDTFDGILGGIWISNAKRPPSGQQCQDCLRTVLKRREPS